MLRTMLAWSADERDFFRTSFRFAWRSGFGRAGDGEVRSEVRSEVQGGGRISVATINIPDDLAAWLREQARANGQSADQFAADVISRARRQGIALTPFQQAIFDRIKGVSAANHGMCSVMEVIGGFLSYDMQEIQAAIDALKEKGKIQDVQGGGYYRVAL